MPPSTAVADKTWDVSVKSLVAFPSVLKQLNEHLDWTQKLGDAMIGQQEDVATSIQRLRAKASAAGTLKTGKEQTVTTQTQGSETIIAIQPTNPEVVYVPTYDPNTAYGAVALPELSADLLPHGWRPDDRPDVGRGHCRGGCDVRRLELGLWRIGQLRERQRQPGDKHRPQLQSRQRRHRRTLAARRRAIARASPTATPQRVSSSDRTVPAPISDSSFADSSKGEPAARWRRRSRRRRRPGGVGGPGGAGGAGRPAASAVPAVSVERVALVASAVPAVSVAQVALVASVVPAVSVARVALVASAVPAASGRGPPRWRRRRRGRPAAAAPTDCPA